MIVKRIMRMDVMADFERQMGDSVAAILEDELYATGLVGDVMVSGAGASCLMVTAGLFDGGDVSFMTSDALNAIVLLGCDEWIGRDEDVAAIMEMTPDESRLGVL